MNVIDWLLESDPSIGWQVMRDLTEAPADEIAAKRAKVANHGWGAQLLGLQRSDGHWADGGSIADWIFATKQTLHLLRDMGLDPESGAARRAVGLVRDNVTWLGVLPDDAAWHGKPFFAGEVEPCLNGSVATIGSYFGVDVRPIIDRLLGEQLDDGGWNCEAMRGSTRGSFNTTIAVLEALLDHERATGGSGDVTAALGRGRAYLLTRRLFRRLSTGEPAHPTFTRLGFPACYHYDVLRGLDHLRVAGVVPDDRMADAIAIVESKRGVDGRWPLEHVHEGSRLVHMGEDLGMPSRWITLRALRVLRWYEDGRIRGNVPPHYR